MTHVTIKDAPYELDDRYVVAQMIRFGQIVPGSVKRGYIKATDIENGARYVDILNCEPVLPLRTSLGRFEVRLFAGRQEPKSDAHSDSHSVCDNDTFSESGENDTVATVNVLIGASSCTRLGETDDNLINASKSGANFECFTQSLDLSIQKTDSHKVDRVAICLGTNDIGKHKDDSEQINLLMTKAEAQVKSAYPASHVGLCSILSHKGKSAQINRPNQSATNVKKFIRKLCAREDKVDYIDLDKLFNRNGTIIRSMFD
ncbi:Hypothetical predicted protein [Mytilus galloprovincialis]|uniref:SGNH hydrolase-type esterase domain-containing protein n=1 Tax=Mytilus galloprovincialis TaxID=29158 RepID=A0A8B6EHI8_MYTGA|nr:Hypothetical predicted protein [Mytilus galloprovincialis]